MILKAAAVGFLLWLVATAAFRFAGQYFFVPDPTWQTVLFVACVPVVALITMGVLKLLHEDPSDRAEAAIALAFPGMLLDAYVTNQFDVVFPNLDPILGQNFGALMLLAYATMIITGLFFTRLAAKDERL
jgi:prolipoprotein diacylglyceryltransferase